MREQAAPSPSPDSDCRGAGRASGEAVESRLRKALAKTWGAILFVVGRAVLFGIEGIRRAGSRLNPRLYVARLRIRAISDGETPLKSDKFAIILIYAQSALPRFTMNLIVALDRAGYNLIIVSNAELDANRRAGLLRHCCLLIERFNTGRDFGGYKDAIGILFRRFPSVSRLIIANDSVYYLEKGLDDLIESLSGPEDFIGVSEIFEHHYHVGAFMLSFGPSVLGDPAFRAFWRHYRPIQTRMWAILEGEGELTRRIMEAGHEPHILFKAERLLPKLEALDAQERAQAVGLFPASMRAALAKADVQAQAVAFGDAVVHETLQRNQMHAAGFAFMKFLGLPLFKRDIVYREFFTIAEARRIMSDLDISMQAEIAADLDRRRPPTRANMLRRLLFENGFA